MICKKREKDSARKENTHIYLGANFLLWHFFTGMIHTALDGWLRTVWISDLPNLGSGAGGLVGGFILSFYIIEAFLAAHLRVSEVKRRGDKKKNTNMFANHSLDTIYTICLREFSLLCQIISIPHN